MKKTLFLFRLFALVATLTCALGANAYDYYYNGLYYILDNNWNQAWVTYRNYGTPTYSGSVNIPGSIPYGGKTYTVVGIAENAFTDCTGMTSVTIPNTVTHICPAAFGGCTGLTSLTLPASVTDINYAAFWECTNLTSITCLSPTPPKFNDYDLTFEDLDPFSDITYTKATLYVPMGSMSAYQATGFWKYWYKFRNIVEFNGEGGYEYFYKDGIYYKITSGNTVEVTYYDVNGNNYSGSVSIPSSVTCDGKAYTVTGIGGSAFYMCENLTSVTLPGTVTCIFPYAFAGCYNLTSINIPGSVQYINERAFAYCYSLTSIDIPGSVVYIGENVFEYCNGLTRVNITDVAAWCNMEMHSNPLILAHHLYLNGTELTNLTIPSSVAAINDYLFKQCYSLKSVTIGNSVTSIGVQAFTECTNLKTLTIDNSVTTIGVGAFAYCSALTSVTIPPLVTTINRMTFAYCSSLSSVTIPNSVNTIDYGAFGACSSLSNVTIGNSVDTIGEYAFSECPALTRVTCLANTPPKMASSYVFSDVTYSNATLTVPGRRLSAYQNDNYWKNFTHIQGDGSFFMVNGIYYVVTGDNTVEVTFKDTNFNSYSGNVTIPQTVTYDGKTYNVTTIGKSAFRESSGLTSVVIPVSVIEIDDNAFHYCSGLTSVVIPSSVTTIGDYAFYGCTNMTNVTLGSSVSSIGFQAFRVCPALLSVTSLATTPPTIKSTTFVNSQYSSVMLFIPKASLGAYQSKTYWKNFTQMHPTLDYALNSSDGSIEFRSQGNYPWTNAVDGTRVYAQSGNKGIHSSISTLTATVTLPRDGHLTFAYKAWGEGSSNDKCIFMVDGVEKFSYGNKQNNWVNYTVQLPAGTHTLMWTYSKNASVNPDGDYFALDNVVLTVNTAPGDADGDGNVTVGDVTAIIDMILSGVTTGNPAADVDGNGSVDIADVTALLDMILSGN